MGERHRQATIRRSARSVASELRPLFEHGVLAVSLLDTSGRILQANEAFCRLVGRSREAVVGATWRSFTHPEDVDRCEAALQRALASGRPVRMERRYLAAGGGIVWADVHAAPLSEEAHAFLLEQAVDTTGARLAADALRAAEARYRELFESPVVAILETTPEGRILTANSVAARLLGYPTPQELVRAVPDVRELWADPSEPDALLQRLATGGAVVDVEAQLRHPSGVPRWLSLTVQPLRDHQGRVTTLRGILLDVTDRRRAREAADAARVEADAARVEADAAREAARSALRRAEEMAEALRRRDEVTNTSLRVLSHDLRGPLGVVMHALEMLGWPDLPEDRRRRLVELASANADRVLRLLDDVCDLERLSRGLAQLRPEPLELEETIQRLVARIDLQGHPVSVEVEGGTVVADRSALERILDNLLTNAIRHTPPATPVWVRAAALPDGVELAVEDAGPGIPRELMARVFEPFERAGASSGRGVGLALVASLARLHGGRAWVEDRPGGGASFRVVLGTPRT